MRSLVAVGSTAKALFMRVHFRLWILRLRLELWRHGGRLVVEAPHVVYLGSGPTIRAFAGEGAPGTTTLRLGRSVLIGKGLTLEIYTGGENLLEIGEGSELQNNVRLQLRGGAIALGPRTQLRDSVWVKSRGEFRTEAEVILSHWVAVHCAERILLEESVGVAERVSIVDSDHTFDGEVHFMKRPIEVAPVRVRRQAMIASGALVLRGVDIGDNSVVAANSVVRSGEYPRTAFIAGNPAKVIKSLTEPGS